MPNVAKSRLLQWHDGAAAGALGKDTRRWRHCRWSTRPDVGAKDRDGEIALHWARGDGVAATGATKRCLFVGIS
jgi:hypothetical protein